jgi:hypothetical protein
MGRGRGGAALRAVASARRPSPPRRAALRACRASALVFKLLASAGGQPSAGFPSEAHDPPVGGGAAAGDVGIRLPRREFPERWSAREEGTASTEQSSRRARLDPDMHRQGGGCP